MNWQRLRWKYWMDVFRRRRLDRDLNDEINSHIALDVQRRIDQGESAEAARIAALREVRSVAFVTEASRDVRAWGALERLAQDLRFATRMLRKSPVFTAIAILSLALGIGANTAIFTMINAILLQNLPVDKPEQLVLLTSFQRNGLVGNFAYPDYERLRVGSKVFSGLLAASRPTPINAGVNNELERALVQIVSGNYFSVLGVRPLLGRMLTDADDDSPVAVISHGFWQRRFGGDPSAIGKPLTVNGSVCQIVGVAPPEFFGETVGQSTDIWAPMNMLPGVRPSAFDLRRVRFVTWLYLMGRLEPGTTVAEALAETETLVARIHEEFRSDPQKDYLHHIAMEPGSRGSAGLRNNFAAVLLVLMTLVAFVLLIACTNLSSLLLVRAASRQREIATRLALGASRWRLIRQLLTESVLLAGMGGAMGLLIAIWINRFLLRLTSEGIGSINVNLLPDGRVLLFTLAVSVLAGILFGLAPAIQTVRVDVGPKLKMHSRAMTGGSRRWGVRNVLVTFQVALSLALLGGGLLFSRTLWNLKTLDTGMRPDNVMLIAFGPQDRSEPNLAARLLERIAAVPGVQSASVSVNVPLGEAGSGVNGLEVQGYTPQSEDDRRARADWVGPGYFKTLGLPILNGREFSMADAANSQRVTIINETMARHYFGDRPAVGQRIRFNATDYEIVGVARDAKYRDLRESTPRMLYFGFLQNPGMPNTLELRTTGPPLELAGTVRDAIRDVDPRLNIREIGALTDMINRKLLPEYLVATISGFFGGVTLLLVCMGIYGTLAFTVARRTNEIGIRMALGAKPSSVVVMVLRDLVRPLGAGLVVGILLVLAGGPLVASLLFEIKGNDPSTIVFAALLLGIVAVIAGYIPARRASRVDPVSALRFE